MGSSAASVECLRWLRRYPELEVVGVVTQPDRPAGRGKVLTPSPVRQYALAENLPAITPENVNADESVACIRAWKPDVIVVVAFGQFLREALLNLPLCGCVNCHFSLLPKYRGASPVVAALAAGERLTGVSVIRMGLGMDDGPILLQAYEPIYSDMTGGRLMDDLALAGGAALAKTLRLMWTNQLPPPVQQNESEATFARKLRKTDGLINWADPVLVTERHIRAYSPWPGCYTFLPARLRKRGNSGRVVITCAEIVHRMEPGWREAAPGTVLKLETGRDVTNGPVVKCGDTALKLTELKPEGGSVMEGGAFLCGRRLVPFEDCLSMN